MTHIIRSNNAFINVNKLYIIEIFIMRINFITNDTFRNNNTPVKLKDL